MEEGSREKFCTRLCKPRENFWTINCFQQLKKPRVIFWTRLFLTTKKTREIFGTLTENFGLFFSYHAFRIPNFSNVFGGHRFTSMKRFTRREAWTCVSFPPHISRQNAHFQTELHFSQLQIYYFPITGSLPLTPKFMILNFQQKKADRTKFQNCKITTIRQLKRKYHCQFYSGEKSAEIT